MAILAIVPGKPNMCLQENLADCVDCGGLPSPPSDIWDIFEFQTFLKNVDPPPLTKLGHF